MFDIASWEAEWTAFDAAPGCYDDVEPPVDLWADPPGVTERVGDLSRSVRQLITELPAAVAAAADTDLVRWLNEFTGTVNRLPAADQVMLAEVDCRGMCHAYGSATTARMLSQWWQVRPAEAAGRVQAARSMGPRRSLTGQPLPPLRPHVAQAQADGMLSPDHARVIDTALRQVDHLADPGVLDTVERTLVELADTVEPQVVARAGRHALAVLDPDWQEPREDRLDRRRGVTLTPRDDGSGAIRGDLTPEVMARLQTVLSPLAAPRPADDARGRDHRTAPQRLHDALGDACSRLLRAGTLPDSGGTPATVIVTMTLAQLEARAGLAVTTFGGTLAVDKLLKYAGECEFIPVVLATDGGILAYGTTRRIATPGQTKALIARDGGCILPGCQTPADWCQRHHVVPWADGGPTNVDNLVLICGYHHRMLDQHGWDIVMADGRPWCRPPTHLDPLRTPLRNTYWDALDTPDVMLAPRANAPNRPSRPTSRHWASTPPADDDPGPPW